jgi:EAL domain-containing protein (putative c-di-GMP-specific phosphodiesterase class I)
VDCIKIDKSFVARLEETPRFVAGLTALATHLGMETVAEGVETRAQAQRLVALNCGAAQGWLYAEALPPDRLEAVLAQGFTPLGVREEVE